MWNCSYYYVPTENWDRYMTYLRRNTLPLQTEKEKTALVLDYRTFIKQPNGDGDWNFAAHAPDRLPAAAVIFPETSP